MSDTSIEVYQADSTNQETLPPDPTRDLGYALQQMADALTGFAEAVGDVLEHENGTIVDAEFTEITR